MKFKKLIFVLFPITVFLIILTGCGESEEASQSNDGVLELSFASYLGENSPPNPVVMWYIEEIEERTNGSVVITPFWSGSLLSGPDTLAGLKDGRADMAYVNPATFPSELPLTNVVAIPFLNDNPETSLYTFYEMYQENEHLKAEWEDQGMHVLNFFPFGNNVIGTKEPINDIEWFEGKGVRGLGYVNQALEAVGANPIAIDAAEVYEALHRNTIEAVSGMTLEAYNTLNYEEVAPHIVDTGLGSYITATMAIRQEVWDRLPDETQEIITEVSIEAQEMSLESLAEWQDQSAEQIIEAGGTIRVLADSEVQKWEEAVGDSIMNEWIKTNEERGVPAEDFLEDYIQTLELYQEDSDYISGSERLSTEN